MALDTVAVETFALRAISRMSMELQAGPNGCYLIIGLFDTENVFRRFCLNRRKTEAKRATLTARERVVPTLSRYRAERGMNLLRNSRDSLERK